MERSRRTLLISGALLGGAAISGVLPAMCSMARNDWKAEVNGGKVPERPSGQPQPMLEEDIAPVLARLDAWYSAHLPSDRYVFNPPAQDEEIDALEALVGIRFPSSYRQLYRWHDGENDDRFGHIYGLPILPLTWVAGEWKVWQQVLSDFDGNRYAIPGAGWPEGAVDPAYVNPRRIPLTSDGSGNSIGLDFDPWPGGRVGQVIVFGRDEDVKVVLAESLGKFLGWIADMLEGGNFRLNVGPDEVVLRDFRLKTPAADGFHEGARILLGAPGQYL